MAAAYWDYRGQAWPRDDKLMRGELWVLICGGIDAAPTVWEQDDAPTAKNPRVVRFAIFARNPAKSPEPVKFNTLAEAKFYCDGVERDVNGDPITTRDTLPTRGAAQGFNKWGRF